MKDFNRVKETTQDYYDQVVNQYIELVKDEIKNKTYDRMLLDQFAQKFQPQAIVVDIGCGSLGHIGRYLNDKGLKVCGIDISPKSIDAAKLHNPGMVFKVMDMSRLQFRDQSLDGMVAFYSIIHIPKVHMHRVFQEFNRVLKPGGWILLAVHKGDGEEVVKEAMGIETELYVSRFHEIEMIEYLTQNGFGFELIESRKPYDFELPTERIYALAKKLF